MTTADIADRHDDRLQREDLEQGANDPSSADRDQEPASRRPSEAADGTAEGNGPAEGIASARDSRSALLDASDSERFRARWMEVQTRFVDAPRDAVQGADALVAELMQQLAKTFARERDTLEQQWTRGADVSTEDLRVALTRYRSFFDRLLEA
jgi:hypothetical protein